MKVFFGVAFALLLAACASGSMSDGYSKYEMGSDEYGPMPELDPDRLVSTQDCTQQIRMDGGNLLCR